LSADTTRTSRPRFGRGCLFAFALIAGASGCSVFDKPLPLTQSSSGNLPPLKPPPGAIQLDVVYVERPVGDRLLGEDLWRNIDQVGAVDAETRAALRQNGFRAGTVGANPPIALQRMLGLQTDFAYEPEAEQTKQWVGRRCVLVSGSETDIQVSRPYPECTVDVSQGRQSQLRRFENAVCKFRIRAVRLQDGWARLEFMPQVHHGQEQLRPDVGAAGWEPQYGQRTDSFFLQRFDVKLSIGEMAVVTADDGASGTLGQLFFRGPAALQAPQELDEAAAGEEAAPSSENDYPIQRLLVVRLAGMSGGEHPFAPGR